jgi:hypothetical protein
MVLQVGGLGVRLRGQDPYRVITSGKKKNEE